MEPFPLFGLQSSHLNICYYHQDLHRRPLRPARAPQVLQRPPRPPTHRGLGTCPDGRNSFTGSSYPEGNFGGNQLLDGSISLSPLYPSRRTICTSGSLRASTRVSSRLRPRSGIVHHLSGPDRHALTRTLLEDQGRSAVQPSRGSRQSASLRLTGLIAR
ncbi:unnamed protein product [Prunus brigantina]